MSDGGSPRMPSRVAPLGFRRDIRVRVVVAAQDPEWLTQPLSGLTRRNVETRPTASPEAFQRELSTVTDAMLIVVHDDGTQNSPLNWLGGDQLGDERRLVWVVHEVPRDPSEDPALRIAARPGLEFIPRAELHEGWIDRLLDAMLHQAALRAALAESERRYELTTLAANDGLWSHDALTGEFHPSARWKSLLGYSEFELDHTIDTWFERVHPEDLAALRDNLDQHLAGLSPAHEFEHRIRHRNGRYRWVLSRAVASRDARGRVVLYAGALTDISRRKASEDQLQLDSVTGLASRMVLIERLGAAISEQSRGDQLRAGLIYVNLDRFRLLNETFGLDAGDQILAQVGARLSGSTPPSALICRCGSDEFAVLFDDASEPTALDQVAKQIHTALARPFVLDGNNAPVSASIGVLVVDGSYQSTGEILRDVGLAMRHAKSRGVSMTAHFSSELRERAAGEHRMRTALQQAVDRQEFEVFYQPIVTLRDERLSGFEALVRWRHPVRGIIAPDEFIPLAEHSGLILEIGRQVLNTACQRLAQWRASWSGGERLTMSVNLSPLQLASAELVGDVERALHLAGLPADALKLEITETAFLNDEPTAMARLHSLRASGVRIYIDDFGTGYSSFSYLDRLDVDGIKIDKSFVRLVGSGDRRAAIVDALVSLAQRLDLAVVAEGIETQGQLSALRSLACHEGQGYLFSRPVAPEAAVEHFRSHIESLRQPTEVVSDAAQN